MTDSSQSSVINFLTQSSLSHHLLILTQSTQPWDVAESSYLTLSLSTRSALYRFQQPTHQEIRQPPPPPPPPLRLPDAVWTDLHLYSCWMYRLPFLPLWIPPMCWTIVLS